MRFLPILILSLFTNFIDLTNGNDLDELFETRWVIDSDKGHIRDLHDFQFVVYNSPATETLPYDFKYGGLTFERGGGLIIHVYAPCGVGDSPNFYKANFQIEEIGDKRFIKITNSIRWDGEYILTALTETNLKLKRKK